MSQATFEQPGRASSSLKKAGFEHEVGRTLRPRTQSGLVIAVKGTDAADSLPCRSTAVTR